MDTEFPQIRVLFTSIQIIQKLAQDERGREISKLISIQTTTNELATIGFESTRKLFNPNTTNEEI